MPSSIFYSIAFGIIFGLISGMFIAPNAITSSWWIYVVGILVWLFILSKITHYSKAFTIVVITIICMGLGYYRTTQFHLQYPFAAFDRFNNQTITIAGTINDNPTFKPGNQYVRIHPEIINGDNISSVTQDIVLKVSDQLKFSYGDQLIVSGLFTVRADFLSDTGRTVNYRLMSYSKKIAGDIRIPNIIQRSSHRSYLSNTFANIKHTFLTTLYSVFISPASGLLAGIMIGDTSSLDGNLLDIFRAVGLIHIVVLSGYNITLVANFFIRIFAPLGYFRRLITAMIALVFFIAVVGISQTALRAGIMALCAFSARYMIRPYIVTRGILLALLVMAWISPYALLFDLSLQLSFLATIGIVYIFPLVSERFTTLMENSFWEILLQTIAVNIVTLPIIVYQMGYFSLISFPINVLVLGIIPALTMGGFLAVVIGMIIISMGKIIAYPIQLITDFLIRLSSFTAAHDPFRITLPPFSLYWLLGIYVVIFYFLIRLLKKQQ